MIKLLAVDMDGTCLDGRSRISDQTLEALQNAAKRGIIVVPTTGRNLECIPHRLAEGTIRRTETADSIANKGLFRYVITSNGARVTDIQEKTQIYQASISRTDALSLLEKCRHKKLGIASHIRHRYLLQGRLLALGGHLLYGKDAWGISCVRNMEEFIRKNKNPVEEFQFYFLAPGSAKTLGRILKDYESLSVSYTKIYAEVYSSKTSKGKALESLRKYLGIAKEETACIGDAENDLSMFKASGYKIAMGNAVAELKKRADYITKTNNRNGVAEIVNKL